MKNMIHKQIVPKARPLRNRWTTGNPGAVGSVISNRVSTGARYLSSIRWRSFAIPALSRFAKTRNRIDSGSTAYCTGSRMSGSSPPTYHTERQPKCGIKTAERPPAAAAPRENPVNMIITSVARLLSGQHSAVSAMAFGIAPPSPRPVMKRKIRSWVSLVDVAVAMVKMPNMVVQIITTHRRPILSATGPNRSAPISRPTSREERVGSNDRSPNRSPAPNAGRPAWQPKHPLRHEWSPSASVR
jgi:hypothetical protein